MTPEEIAKDLDDLVPEENIRLLPEDFDLLFRLLREKTRRLIVSAYDIGAAEMRERAARVSKAQKHFDDAELCKKYL